MLSTKATRLLPSMSEEDGSGDCEEPKAVRLENDRAVIAMSALGKRESNRREQGFLSLVVECHWRQHRMGHPGYAGKEMKGV